MLFYYQLAIKKKFQVSRLPCFFQQQQQGPVIKGVSVSRTLSKANASLNNYNLYNYICVWHFSNFHKSIILQHELSPDFLLTPLHGHWVPNYCVAFKLYVDSPIKNKEVINNGLFIFAHRFNNSFQALFISTHWIEYCTTIHQQLPSSLLLTNRYKKE